MRQYKGEEEKIVYVYGFCEFSHEDHSVASRHWERCRIRLKEMREIMWC